MARSLLDTYRVTKGYGDPARALVRALLLAHRQGIAQAGSPDRMPHDPNMRWVDVPPRAASLLHGLCGYLCSREDGYTVIDLRSPPRTVLVPYKDGFCRDYIHGDRLSHHPRTPSERAIQTGTVAILVRMGLLAKGVIADGTTYLLPSKKAEDVFAWDYRAGLAIHEDVEIVLEDGTRHLLERRAKPGEDEVLPRLRDTELWTARYRATVRGILGSEREARRYRMSSDTAGALTRALMAAFRTGQQDPDPAPRREEPEEGVDWTLWERIPKAAASLLEAVCQSGFEAPRDHASPDRTLYIREWNRSATDTMVLYRQMPTYDGYQPVPDHWRIVERGPDGKPVMLSERQGARVVESLFRRGLMKEMTAEGTTWGMVTEKGWEAFVVHRMLQARQGDWHVQVVPDIDSDVSRAPKV